MSLILAYRDVIIPDLEKMVEGVSDNGKKKLITVKQKDGAGPYQDKTYLDFMSCEFKRRDWIIFNQPSQSPVLNTCDTCYFSMASKQVSKEQGLLFGGKLLQGEELF